MKPSVITHPDRRCGDVPLDALRAEQRVVDLDGRRLGHVLHERDGLGLRVGVLGELAADEVEGEERLDGQLLPRPEEGRQEPQDQLEGDLERTRGKGDGALVGAVKRRRRPLPSANQGRFTRCSPAGRRTMDSFRRRHEAAKQ